MATQYYKILCSMGTNSTRTLSRSNLKCVRNVIVANDLPKTLFPSCSRTVSILNKSAFVSQYIQPCTQAPHPPTHTTKTHKTVFSCIYSRPQQPLSLWLACFSIQGIRSINLLVTADFCPIVAVKIGSSCVGCRASQIPTCRFSY